MVDTVDYELPFGVIGMMMHSLIVKKKIGAYFRLSLSGFGSPI
jgi:hypothetical protein